MVTDPVADLLTRIRNAQRAKHYTVRISASSMAERILAVLSEEGFIESFEKKKDSDEKYEEFEVALKYHSDGEPMISQAKRVSSPGRRIYAKSAEIQQVHHGLGISIISTSQGVVSDRVARQKKIGGEVLANIC